MTRIFSPFGGATQTGGGGLPAGGTAGQIIVKQSTADGDALWEDPGPRFLPVPDEIDDVDAVYFYYGWIDLNGGGWQVRRKVKTSLVKQDATVATNPGYPDLATAWPDRATLSYT